MNFISLIIKDYHKKFLDISLLTIFKYSTIIHLLCTLFNLIFYRYLDLSGYTDEIVYYTDYTATIMICLIITIKTIQIITKKNAQKLQNHFIIGTIIEYIIAFFILIVTFFNKSISKNFIIYLAILSKEVSNDDILFIMFLLILYFLYHLYETQKKKIDISTQKSLRKKIISYILQLSIKISIISGIIIQSANPLLYIFNRAEMQEFQNIIFHFTSTTFLFYIHVITIFLVGTCIIQLIYVYRNHSNEL